MGKAFKPIDIKDKATIDGFLAQDPPRISELTFTNLFVWRFHYHPLWCVWQGCLLIILSPPGEPPFGLFPVGPGDKGRALERLFSLLGERTGGAAVCRVGEESVRRFVDRERYRVLPDRDNSDYVYRSRDLIQLPGRRYHRKKNHVNRFLKAYPFEYKDLDSRILQGFLDMQESWCQIRACVEDPALLSEDRAVYEALTWYAELGCRGGAIFIDGKVEAFSIGEPLNPDTAVIHFEKANPGIPDLYAAINQRFCENAWGEMTYINREQDLGIEGLRKAKESYLPHHMVQKFTLKRRSRDG